MEQQFPDRRTELASFTMVLLRCDDRYLMLQRSSEKLFAPGRWSGIGGRVEPHEMDDLYASARREILEETGIEDRSIRNLVLRRALLQIRPGYPLTVLLYVTGETDQRVNREFREGSLHWLAAGEIAEVDVIENTGMVIPLLIDDMRRDPSGSEPVVTGACAFGEDGVLESLVWIGPNPVRD
jgi:8-oxo-dGTP diphosphatase